jgi:hypothetical protein
MDNNMLLRLAQDPTTAQAILALGTMANDIGTSGQANNSDLMSAYNRYGAMERRGQPTAEQQIELGARGQLQNDLSGAKTFEDKQAAIERYLINSGKGSDVYSHLNSLASENQRLNNENQKFLMERGTNAEKENFNRARGMKVDKDKVVGDYNDLNEKFQGMLTAIKQNNEGKIEKKNNEVVSGKPINDNVTKSAIIDFYSKLSNSDLRGLETTNPDVFSGLAHAGIPYVSALATIIGNPNPKVVSLTNDDIFALARIAEGLVNKAKEKAIFGLININRAAKTMGLNTDYIFTLNETALIDAAENRFKEIAKQNETIKNSAGIEGMASYINNNPESQQFDKKTWI